MAIAESAGTHTVTLDAVANTDTVESNVQYYVKVYLTDFTTVVDYFPFTVTVTNCVITSYTTAVPTGAPHSYEIKDITAGTFTVPEWT